MPGLLITLLTFALYHTSSASTALPEEAGAEVCGITAEHNRLRALHGVSPLAWDASLASLAQEYADRFTSDSCRTPHVNTDPTCDAACKAKFAKGYGENIAWSSGDVAHMTGINAVTNWYKERDCYDFNKPWGAKSAGGGCDMPCVAAQYSSGCGHLTQVLWKKTTKVGCGRCKSSSGTSVFCFYNPAGNMIPQDKMITANVPDSSTPASDAYKTCAQVSPQCTNPPEPGSSCGLGLQITCNVPDKSVETGGNCLADSWCKVGFCCPYLKKCVPDSRTGVSAGKTGIARCVPTCFAQYPDVKNIESCTCANPLFPAEWVEACKVSLGNGVATVAGKMNLAGPSLADCQKTDFQSAIKSSIAKAMNLEVKKNCLIALSFSTTGRRRRLLADSSVVVVDYTVEVYAKDAVAAGTLGRSAASAFASKQASLNADIATACSGNDCGYMMAQSPESLTVPTATASCANCPTVDSLTGGADVPLALPFGGGFAYGFIWIVLFFVVALVAFTCGMDTRAHAKKMAEDKGLVGNKLMAVVVSLAVFAFIIFILGNAAVNAGGFWVGMLVALGLCFAFCAIANVVVGQRTKRIGKELDEEGEKDVDAVGATHHSKDDPIVAAAAMYKILTAPCAGVCAGFSIGKANAAGGEEEKPELVVEDLMPAPTASTRSPTHAS